MNLHIAAIYTLFGRRAGAEMFFEKTLGTTRQLFPGARWTVFCNREAEAVLQDSAGPGLNPIYVPLLDNQFRKAFWLEFMARPRVDALTPDLFWNPSGCNSFPGRWQCPTLTTFLDLGEYHVAGKYDWVRMVFRKQICIPRSVRRSAAFTAISQSTADDMARFLGVRAKVAVVHPGPATHGPGRVADAGALLQAQGCAAGRYFLVPGRTDFIGKGLDLILAAQERMGDAWPKDIQWIFVGPSGEGHARFLKRLKESDRGGGRLKYLGRVEEDLLGALYRGCLATVLPSRFEGFGFPVLEAMGHGVPVLCSDAGSLPEVAGDAALIFRSGDLEDLMVKMGRLAADETLRKQLAARGAGRVAQFSWEKCATGMMEVFQRVSEEGAQ